LKLDPHDCFKTYLSIKNHFTQEKYDYHKYCGKTRSSLQSFYKRKDRFFFEKMSRQKSDEEILSFFVANFSSAEDPQSLWIGDIIKEGESVYLNWQKKSQSLKYCFEQEINDLFLDDDFVSLFKINGSSHPKILKKFLRKEVSLETLVILDKILNFRQRFDKKLTDPVWQFVSLKIKKYSSFIHIDIFKFKRILKECLE
jgi:hypothetical protein